MKKTNSRSRALRAALAVATTGLVAMGCGTAEDSATTDTGNNADTSTADTSVSDTGGEDTGSEDTGPGDVRPDDVRPQDVGPSDTGPEDVEPTDVGPQDTEPDLPPRPDVGQDPDLDVPPDPDVAEDTAEDAILDIGADGGPACYDESDGVCPEGCTENNDIDCCEANNDEFTWCDYYPNGGGCGCSVEGPFAPPGL